MGIRQLVSCDNCGGVLPDPPTLILLSPFVRGQQVGQVVACSEDCALAVIKAFAQARQQEEAPDESAGG